MKLRIPPPAVTRRVKAEPVLPVDQAKVRALAWLGRRSFSQSSLTEQFVLDTYYAELDRSEHLREGGPSPSPLLMWWLGKKKTGRWLN